MTEINYPLLGKKIKERRLELRITQEQLASYLDVNPSHISNIENARSYPSLTALFTIANYLECGLDYLLGEQFSYEIDKSANNILDKRLESALKTCSNEKKEKILKIIDII